MFRYLIGVVKSDESSIIALPHFCYGRSKDSKVRLIAPSLVVLTLYRSACRKRYLKVFDGAYHPTPNKEGVTWIQGSTGDVGAYPFFESHFC